MTTVLPVEPLHWEHRAECRNHDPELWWPVSAGGRGEDTSGTDQAAAAAAVAICYRHCPVRQECLDRAVTTGERHGIWGGLWPHERSLYAQGRGIPPPPPGPEVPAALSERARAVAVLRDEGATVGQIARYYGVTQRQAYRWLRELDKILQGADR